jgi:hypothetical protein
MRMPGTPGISKPPMVMGFSTKRSHSEQHRDATMPARTLPVMDPSPPVTTIMSTLKVKTKRNILGSMVVSRLAQQRTADAGEEGPEGEGDHLVLERR